MKTLLRITLINLLTLYLADLLYPGFSLSHQITTLLYASVIWVVLNRVAKPIIKLLLLPINLITLGLFSWLVSVITLFMLVYFIPQVNITPYQFPGLSYQGFIIPPMYINILLSYLVVSILLNSIQSAIIWLISNH